MDKEMTEQEAFEAWLSDNRPETFDEEREFYYVIWQAACKWQREKDAETFAKVEVMRSAILNQGSKE